MLSWKRHAAVFACVTTLTTGIALSSASAAEENPDAPTTNNNVPPPPPPASEDKPIVVWPTLTPAGDDGSPVHRPTPAEGVIHARAMELDATLRDAVQDLGFTLDVADPGPSSNHARELDLIERAQHSRSRATPEPTSPPGAPPDATPGATTDQGTWIVSARLEPASGDSFILRILAVPPKGKQIRVRVERVQGADVSVRGLVLLRDLLAATPARTSDSGPRPQESAGAGIMAPLHSPGRAVLAVNAALFGAFMAFSVQRASGSEDPRLLYPLLALGTGVGLGSALLVAEEWNVSTGDAWTLAGGAWWGTAAGILIANGQKVQPLTDRYAWGVGGGLLGLGLATFSLTRKSADEGDAVLVHSGAGVGLGLGALSDYFYRGDLNKTPYTGAGLGAATGVLAGGTFAVLTQVSPSRVLLIDLGAGLGAAGGAAIGSPLVFEDVNKEKTRGFVAATFGGTLVGGALAWWFTRDRSSSRPAPSNARIGGVLGGPNHVTPFGGTIGSSATKFGEVPAYGLGLRGVF